MPTTERDGIALSYQDEGDGPAVVLLHSFLISTAMWREQAPVLARTHRVLNLDMRGHGASGPAVTPFSLEDLVDDVLAVMDHAGVERAVWSGLSIGGMIALRAALEAPERVSALILMDTHAGAERALVKLKYRAMGVAARIVGMKPLLPAVLPLMLGRTTLETRPDVTAEIRQALAANHVPSVLCGLRSLIGRRSLEGRLAEITMPALVIVGEEDRALPPQLSRRLHAGLPDARLLEIPAAGHLAALERPDVVNPAMTDFLAALA